MSKLKKWIGKRKEPFQTVSPNELATLQSELDSAEVSLSAGNIFPVTYGMVANVLTYKSLYT